MKSEIQPVIDVSNPEESWKFQPVLGTVRLLMNNYHVLNESHLSRLTHRITGVRLTDLLLAF